MLIAICRKPTAATTSTRCTASTSMPEFSCPTSACSVTTTSTTGLISRPMFLRTRHGSSMACACRFFPPRHLKIEPWFINGWQSYGRFNNRPGVGGQILWRPNGWLSVLGNQYALGEDALNTPDRTALSHRRQHRGQVLRQPENVHGQDGVLADRRPRMRTRRRRELHGQFGETGRSRVSSASCSTTASGFTRTGTA